MNITVTIAFYLGSGGFKRGEPGRATPLSPLDFFLTKAKFTSKKLVLDEYEVCLKMLEMANLETQIFKTFRKGMPQDPSRKLAPLALVMLPSESPGSAPV